MVELLTDFKRHLPKMLVFCPDLAELACQCLWRSLPVDIREVAIGSDTYVALVEINRVVYCAVVFDFFVSNALAESQHLEKLETICSIVHQLTGLTHVAAIHLKHGVMAEFNAESEPRYTLWSF